jgi:hypothetical protein
VASSRYQFCLAYLGKCGQFISVIECPHKLGHDCPYPRGPVYDLLTEDAGVGLFCQLDGRQMGQEVRLFTMFDKNNKTETPDGTSCQF